jgi:hypothetical protein
MATFVSLPFGRTVLDDESPRRRRSKAAPTADLRLRVPADLKHDIEAEAARAGLPADLWLVEALGRSVSSARA